MATNERTAAIANERYRYLKVRVGVCAVFCVLRVCFRWHGTNGCGGFGGARHATVRAPCPLLRADRPDGE